MIREQLLNACKQVLRWANSEVDTPKNEQAKLDEMLETVRKAVRDAESTKT